jgi:hypothetical protein
MTGSEDGRPAVTLAPAETQPPEATPVSRKPDLTRLARWLWGDVALRDKIIRFSLKVGIAFLLAYFVHELAVRISTSIPDSAALSSVESKINNELKSSLKGDWFKVCLLFPHHKSPDCPDASNGSSYLGFALVDSRSKLPPKPEWFFHVTKPIWIASTPTIEHSVDSFLREIERYAFNEKPGSITNLQLCAGTRRPLDDEKCQTTSRIGKTLHEPLDGLMDRVRKSAMLFGDVQLLSLTVFVIICFEVIGLYFIHVFPKPILFEIKKAEGLESVSAWDDDTFAQRLEDLSKRPEASIGDRLYSWLVFARIEPPYSRNYTPVAASAESVGTFHDFRSVLTELAEIHISGLEKTAENILKLSFAGTIIGIGTSLFAARNLDTADPTGKLLVKSEMFAGIGVAFGTTLVGVILSILAAVVLRRFSASWLGEINRHYELMIEGMQFSPETLLPSFVPNPKVQADKTPPPIPEAIKQALKTVVTPVAQEEGSRSYRVGSILLLATLIVVSVIYQANIISAIEQVSSFISSLRQ